MLIMAFKYKADLPSHCAAGDPVRVRVPAGALRLVLVSSELHQSASKLPLTTLFSYSPALASLLDTGTPAPPPFKGMQVGGVI